MTPTITRLARQLYHAVALALLLVAVGAVAPPPSLAATEAAALAPGMARIWVYREYEPYVTLDRPYVRFNGKVVAISEPGGAFYRDVPAGTYRITVDSQGRDVYQFATVSVAPGQQIYIKVEALRDWDSGGGGSGGYWFHPTFYTRLQLPQVALAEIARVGFYGGN